MLCFRTLCVLGGGICRPRVNGLARVDERGVCFVVVPIKFSVGVRHVLIAPQSYDVRVHVYTYSKPGIDLGVVCCHAHRTGNCATAIGESAVCLQHYEQ